MRKIQAIQPREWHLDRVAEPLSEPLVEDECDVMLATAQITDIEALPSSWYGEYRYVILAMDPVTETPAALVYLSTYDPRD